MLKILKYLKPYTLQIILIFVLVYIQVQMNLLLPDYMAKIVNEGIVGNNNDLILNTGLEMLGISLIGGIATVGFGFLAAKVATGYASDLRNRTFAKIESFSMTEFDKFSTASLITRSTNDIQQIQIVLIMVLRMVLMAPITGIGAVIKAYALAPNMSWIIALAVLVIIGIIVTLFFVAIPKFKILQKLVDKLNLVTRENLTGLRVIRAFNNEEYEEEKFDKANKDLTKVNLFVNRLMVILQPVMMLIFNFTAIAIVWIGAQYIETGVLKIGDMMAFMQYAMQVIMSFLMLSMIFILIPRASVSASRVAEVLETEPAIKDPKNPVDFKTGINGIVEFKDVTFSYPDSDTPVLKNISFKANPGQTTAFIGSTGSGKSTLINLIPRFYDVSSGQVLIDGVNVKDVTQEDLHDKIGFVPQKGVLFSGTIESNLKYGAPSASDEELEESAEIAQATDFIKKLEKDFGSPIAQGGANVSGGQKQRLSIARAIIKKPEIYIFDDSFSALDFKTDAKLRQALNKATVGATVMIVAQRISTIMHADKIIVLDEGEIVGIGTNDELLKSCEVYKEIAYSQLSKEEMKKESVNYQAGKEALL